MKKCDMHTHNSDGSIDGKVSVMETIEILKSMGFGGMMVTDHNSYSGYDSVDFSKIGDFTVFRGIEYDTFEYGHFIIIMPDGEVPLRILHRGMRLEKLIDFVHRHGGIIGPAHPTAEVFLSFYTTGIKFKRYEALDRILKKLDFLEGFNACESKRINHAARVLASRYNLPTLGGSDGHTADCVGFGYTYIPDDIKTNNDLIAYIKTRPRIRIGGSFYGKTLKDRIGQYWNNFLLAGFFPYNKVMTFKVWSLEHIKRQSKWIND